MSLSERSPSEVTLLLHQWSGGDASALERLVVLIYRDLRRIANHHLREEPSDHTLQPTALINEVFLRLMDQHSTRWESRSHFFGATSELMRRILVDYAHRRNAEKRGALFLRVPLTEVNEPIGQFGFDFVALNDALTRLAAVDEQLAHVVDLRFFGGLSVDETASVLGVSSATVKREWALAKAWLFRKMSVA